MILLMLAISYRLYVKGEVTLGSIRPYVAPSSTVLLVADINRPAESILYGPCGRGIEDLTI